MWMARYFWRLRLYILIIHTFLKQVSLAAALQFDIAKTESTKLQISNGISPNAIPTDPFSFHNKAPLPSDVIEFKHYNSPHVTYDLAMETLLQCYAHLIPAYISLPSLECSTITYDLDFKTEMRFTDPPGTPADEKYEHYRRALNRTKRFLVLWRDAAWVPGFEGVYSSGMDRRTVPGVTKKEGGGERW